MGVAEVFFGDNSPKPGQIWMEHVVDVCCFSAVGAFRSVQHHASTNQHNVASRQSCISQEEGSAAATSGPRQWSHAEPVGSRVLFYTRSAAAVTDRPPAITCQDRSGKTAWGQVHITARRSAETSHA